MTEQRFEILSNQAVAACAVLYFLALLTQAAAWASRRQLASSQTAKTVVGAGQTSVTNEGHSTENRSPVEGFERLAFLRRTGLNLLVFAACIQAAALVARGLAADPPRAPWSNMYEFTLTGTLMVTVIYLALYPRFDLAWLGPVITGFVLVILMVNVLTLYEPVVPLQDSLRSPWLVIHVAAANIATAAFTLGGMISVLFILKERFESKSVGDREGYIARLPAASVLDQISYRVHAFAFPIWTFGVLIAGPIWAYAAWGRYWGWDPKEIWAFVTWVIYAAYLHARATAGWKGRVAAIIALIGLATVWFNAIGINFIFGEGSQHSYA